jgi:alpha-glucosidase (family GH31 glycosyl hydrolase)
MRAANIPLEGMGDVHAQPADLILTTPHAVMWNDLELYHDYRDFTTDPATFPAEETRKFIRDLVSRSIPLQELVERS